MTSYSCLCVCVSVAVIICVHSSVVVSVTGSYCPVGPDLFAVSAASSVVTFCLHDAAVARPIVATAHHCFHHVCRLLGCLVRRAILDSDHDRQQSILAASDASKCW